MYRRGVTCMDCHEPHALKLRAEGNAPVRAVTAAAAFDTGQHHFHKAGSKGAQCVECHMPAQAYMVVDPRRDHSIRVPRPDLSESLGTPNACTGCHEDRRPRWAASAMDQWYGTVWRARSQYGTELHTPRGRAKALPCSRSRAIRLLPPIVQATAATLAQPYVRAGDLAPSAGCW
jgi:hypothetical protein